MMSEAGGNTGYLASVKKVWQAEGATGFYRGWIPPFFGSVIFRSLQFTVYEAVYSNIESDSMK